MMSCNSVTNCHIHSYPPPSLPCPSHVFVCGCAVLEYGFLQLNKVFQRGGSILRAAFYVRSIFIVLLQPAAAAWSLMESWWILNTEAGVEHGACQPLVGSISSDLWVSVGLFTCLDIYWFMKLLKFISVTKYPLKDNVYRYIFGKQRSGD